MKIAKTKILFIFMALLSCVFAFSYPKDNQIVNAASFTNAGTELSLVGYNGYKPSDYFDELNQINIKSSDKNYLNYDGEIQNEYYILTPKNSNVIGALSIAKTTVTPYGDYITLANQGCLYVALRTGIVTDIGDKNSVKLTLSTNNNSTSKTNNGLGYEKDDIYCPFYYQTDFIKVDASSNIEIQLENLAKASVFSGAKFKLFEPKLIFKVILNETDINFSISNETAYYNDMINLSSSTTISNITGGTLINYYKSLHSVSYEIIEGKELAQLVGNYLHFKGNKSGTVKIRAKCLNDSLDKKYIYTKDVSINYIYEEVEIKVNKNFTNSATILGEGKYYAGYQVDLKANINEGYKFAYWLIEGQKYFDENISFVCKKDINVELKCYKYISIEKIIVKDKIYDGTTSLQVDYVSLLGVENDDELEVNFEKIEFSSANVGLKPINILNPSLSGNCEFYILNGAIPDVNAIINPKSLLMEIKSKQKEYGQNDPEIEYTITGLVGNDTANEILSRESGEDVGKYNYLASISNSNYSLTKKEAILQIVKREISINSAKYLKCYDGTNYLEIESIPENLVFSDNISCKISTNFESSNVGLYKLNILEYELIGDKTQNYVLNKINDLYVEVTAKNATLTIKNSQKTYGDSDPTFEYEFDGLIDGDQINITLSRSGTEDVGVYSISYEIDENDNYNLNITQGYLTINQRQITVTANYVEKTYGDNDPVLTYETQNMLEGTFIEGALTRCVGENVGEYEIQLGSLYNKNYEIAFVSNKLKINKRYTDITFIVPEKEYDGSKNVKTSTYTFNNVISGDIVTLEYNAEYESSDVGDSIEINFTDIVVSNENYFVDNEKQILGKIAKRNIIITPQNQTKVFGENDPLLSFQAQNSFEGLILNGSLTREVGENVGAYIINQGTLTDQNNSNLSIKFITSGVFTITQRTISYKIDNYTKFYGENDPEYEIVIENSEFVNGDNFKTITTGQVSRQTGETPGLYEIYTDDIILTNNNYKLDYISTSYLTISKQNIIVTAQSANKIYGENDPVFTFTVNDGRYLNDLSNFTLERETGETVGSYKIGYVSLYSDLFNITFEYAYLTIKPREIVLKAEDKYKRYGSVDPTFNCIIISGILINGDKLNEISSGNISRVSGENVGEYEIIQNNFALNSNYTLIFISGKLTIEKQRIKIKANDKTKEYNETDPSLNYEIISGSLCFNDEFNGELTRESGEQIGNYKILMGTLSLNNNYDLQFEKGTFTIEKIKLIVTVQDQTKVYGDEDPEININYSKVIADDLNGEIYRKTGEDVGTYEYLSTLQNEHYEIECILGSLSITKRSITIKANSYEINYGEQTPKFEYEIIDGEIVNDDKVQGELYKLGQDNVGTYKILSSLNLGRNYQIEYIEGEFTINPINIELKITKDSKIYGEKDPEITYEVYNGELLNDDYFTGSINRTNGEDVGEYNIINNLVNDNYIINIVDQTFKILPRKVNLHIRVKDKIYDACNSAEIETLSISNVLDEEVSVVYNAKTSATFKTINVANDIEINLENIYLSGNKKDNYELVYPVVFANITYEKLENENVTIFANYNTELVEGSSIYMNNIDMQNFNGQETLRVFDLQIKNNNDNVNLEKNVEVCVNLENDNYENYRVYILDGEGNTHKVKANYRKGSITFETNTLGLVVITAKNTNWIDYVSLGCIGLLMVILIVKIIIKKRKKYVN